MFEYITSNFHAQSSGGFSKDKYSCPARNHRDSQNRNPAVENTGGSKRKSTNHICPAGQQCGRDSDHETRSESPAPLPVSSDQHISQTTQQPPCHTEPQHSEVRDHDRVCERRITGGRNRNFSLPPPGWDQISLKVPIRLAGVRLEAHDRPAGRNRDLAFVRGLNEVAAQVVEPRMKTVV